MENPITQKEINRLADKVGKVSETIREVNAMAFRLAKDGNRNGVFQLRGAFSGTLQAAQTADGFLSGLAAMFNYHENGKGKGSENPREGRVGVRRGRDRVRRKPPA